MNIIIHSNDSMHAFKTKLESFADTTLINRIVFDITADGDSKLVLQPSDNGSYIVSYSRPLWFNLLKPPLSEFEFRFSVNKDEQNDSIKISGTIRPKKYIIGAILLVLLVILYNVYVMQFPSSFMFLYVAPSVIFIYLLIEYYFFRRRIKRFFAMM